MSHKTELGLRVFNRINERCLDEMETGRGCPSEVFVSTVDWNSLDMYLKTKATYRDVPSMFSTMSIKIQVDGCNQTVEVRDIGLLVVV